MKKGFTCREVYEEGAALLDALEDGRLDARLLLEHFCGINTHRLLADPDLPVQAAEREAFLAGVRRRLLREPLAYIIGEQFFMGLPFAVSPDVLIPEQDTENLVEEALKFMEDGARILDLCTGSGCILLSLLHYSNGCVGVGTDLSPAALAVARQNARALGLEANTVWLQGDLFAALENVLTDLPGAADQKDVPCDAPALISGSGSRSNTFCREEPDAPAGPGAAASAAAAPDRRDIPERFDLIISNPPYIPTAVIGTLAPEVRCAEPGMALDGGADGLDFYRRIIAQAPDHLVIGGRLMLEIGYDQGEAVAALLEDAGYYGVEILKDYGGNDRVATAVRSALQQN